MKSIHLLLAAAAFAGIAQVGEAGLFDRIICRKDGKRCDCDCVPTAAPQCCKPVIVKPCCTTVHTYQRRCSNLKPPCCNECGPAACCAPSSVCGGCGSNDCCCASRAGCGKTGCCGNGCCGDACCDGSGCDGCCPDNCCDLAQLIYESQTGCYARQRKRAVHRLSDRYECVCHPEVMCALIYALNDADEDVRAKAADEIGDQLRKNPCCCSQKVVSALTCALADCHWMVRLQAKQALKRCGYRVVNGCDMGCCDTGCCGTNCCGADCCGSACHATGAPAYAPSPAAPSDLPPGEGAAPAAAPAAPAAGQPAPPPSAYFQKPSIRQMSGTVSPARKGLSALIEIFD